MTMLEIQVQSLYGVFCVNVQMINREYWVVPRTSKQQSLLFILLNAAKTGGVGKNKHMSKNNAG